jgi:L-methionine (R)-S-oxide reductase
MTEALSIPDNLSREEIYRAILPQIAGVIDGIDDLVANLANISAILKEAFGFHWVGFYRTHAPQELILGPFQGPLACVKIPFSKGVCGAAARKGETIIVPDVNVFPGHIACSALTKSEIVVPLVHEGKTELVLDVDSIHAADFDETDQHYLEQIVELIRKQHF